MDEKDEKKLDEENLKNAAIAGASAEVVQRYGSAAKEHYVAFSGKDNEAGIQKVKSLKSMSQSKVNSDYEFNNIHQQAGFSAEIEETANVNSENIINKNPERMIRTDDLGSVNDPIFDHVMIYSNGDIIQGSGAQMKYIGASAADPDDIGATKRALDKLQSKKFEKYLDNDAKIEVPSDYYDEMISDADKQIADYTKQLERVTALENSKDASKLEQKIQKLEKIKKNLRKSTSSMDEAVYARLHPELATAKNVMKISHRAGLETAKPVAVINGSVSLIRNIVDVVKGKTDPDEAARQVAVDTGTGAVVGYASGLTGSAIEGAMKNANSEYIRTLSNTNLAGTLVSVGIATIKTLKRYFDREIDGVECFEELGESGTGMISASLFATIGQAAIPIPVVGGMIGSILGYAISSVSYAFLRDSLKKAKIAHEQRIEIEKACENHIKLIKEYRAELQDNIDEYLSMQVEIFNDAFSQFKESLQIGDIDGFIGNSNTISKALGREPQFSSIDEFNNLMNSSTALKL